MSPADATLAEAAAAYRAGRLDEAEALLRELLGGRADDPGALHFLGLVHYRRGDAAKAIDLIRESLRIAPDEARVWNNLGNLLLEGRRLEGARLAFEEAIRLAPEMPSAWSNLGICLRRQGKVEAAIAAYRRAIEIEPGFAPALENLGIALDGVGRVEEATAVYRQWLAYDPDSATARHLLAARTGLQVPSRAEEGYVATLFDRYASTFDDRLAALGYRAPEILASALAGFVAPAAGPLDLLDAGCGTGLLGPLLRPRARTLIGVDLSPGMIARARKRGVYDELAVGELCAFMRSRPAAFDAVVAADALVYFGALGEVLAAASACLRAGGVVAFTLEALESGPAPEGYRLAPHGRYAHDAAYVRETLAAAGFRDLQMTRAVLRQEVGRDVQGHVALARAGELPAGARGGAVVAGASAP